MESIVIFILHLLLYGIPPLVIVKLIKIDKSMTYFYAYFGFLFVFAQLFAVFYSIRILNDLVITGGNIAYSSIILITLIITIESQEPTIVRNLISIQVILNIFLFFLYLLLAEVLTDPNTINIFGVSPTIFYTTITVNIVSSCVFIIEILAMFYILEVLKKHIKNLYIIIFLSIWVYIGILCLDGFLFPFLISIFQPEFGQFIVGSIYGKFILGLGFSPFLLTFLIINKDDLEKYLEEPFMIKYLIIPPRKELIKELERAEHDLKESEEKYRKAYNQATFFKDLFTHDISNIIQNIKMSLDLTKNYRTKDSIKNIKEYEKLYDMMDNQLDRAITLITNIRKLSNIEEQVIELESLDLLEFLSNAIKFVKKSFPNKEINIEIDSINNTIIIKANELLSDVFENILLNAIKYNDNPIPKIDIKISNTNIEKKDYVRVEFIDNGIGISDSKKDKIFLSGHQEFKGDLGMGIGLSLVAKVTELFQGKIWVENRVEGDHTKGSNFILILPL